MTPGGARPSEPWLPVAAAMLPVLAAVWLVAQYGVDVPRLDDWSLATILTCEDEPSCFDWHSLARQHVESRPLTSRLLVVALAPLVGFDVRWLMVGSVVAAGVASLCLLRIARATLPLPPARVGWLWAAANVLLFGVAQAETWLHAAQVAAYLVLAALYGALALAASRAPVWLRALGGVALAAVCTFSMTAGLLAWLLVPPVLALGLAPRERVRWLGVFALGAALTLALYFAGFEDRSPGDWQALTEPHRALAYALVFLGSPYGSAFGPAGPLDAWISGVLGAVLAGALSACVVALARLRNLDRWRQAAPWLAIAAFAVGSAGMAAIGRLAEGVEQALSPRYFVWSVELGVALLFLVPIAFEGRRGLQRFGPALAALLLAAWAGTSLRVGLGLDAVHAEQLAMKAALAFATTAPERPWLGRMFLFPDRLVARARTLDERGLLAPPLARSERIGESAQSLQPQPQLGAIAQYRELADELVVRGSSRLPGRDAPADAVLLCASEPGGEPRVAALLGDTRSLDPKGLLGWRGRLDRTRLRAGESVVTVWAYDALVGRAYRLAGEVVLTPSEPATAR